MFSDRIWSQMQFTIKWSLVSLVFSEMPGPEWLHVRSLFFGHGDHDFLVCFDTRIVGLIAEVQQCICSDWKMLETQSANLQAKSGLEGILSKHFFCSEEGFQVQNALSLFTVNDPTNSPPWILTCHCAQPLRTHMRRIWNPPIRNIHAYVFATLQDIRTSFCTLIRWQTIHSSGLDDVLASCNTGYYVTDQENNKNSYPQHSYSSPKIWGIHEINDICFLN